MERSEQRITSLRVRQHMWQSVIEDQDPAATPPRNHVYLCDEWCQNVVGFGHVCTGEAAATALVFSQNFGHNMLIAVSVDTSKFDAVRMMFTHAGKSLPTISEDDKDETHSVAS